MPSNKNKEAETHDEQQAAVDPAEETRRRTAETLQTPPQDKRALQAQQLAEQQEELAQTDAQRRAVEAREVIDRSQDFERNQHGQALNIEPLIHPTELDQTSDDR